MAGERAYPLPCPVCGGSRLTDNMSAGRNCQCGPLAPPERVITKAQRRALSYILAEGPGTLPATKSGRVTAAVCGLVDAGFLETLNRIRPGPVMYEITPAGRQALDGKAP